jgi:fructose/tagatose bisphosphate aldolase
VIEEIHRRMPNVHLVMHGSSSVPQDLQDIINKYGGKMPQTWGVPVEEIQRGIKHGVRKINIDTDNRMAITGAIRKILAEQPGRVRSAQVSQARHGRHAPSSAVQHGWPGGQDQAAAAVRDGEALCGWRPEGQGRLSLSRR